MGYTYRTLLHPSQFTLGYCGETSQININWDSIVSISKYLESSCFEAKEPSRGQTWDRAKAEGRQSWKSN